MLATKATDVIIKLYRARKVIKKYIFNYYTKLPFAVYYRHWHVFCFSLIWHMVKDKYVVAPVWGTV